MEGGQRLVGIAGTSAMVVALAVTSARNAWTLAGVRAGGCGSRDAVRPENLPFDELLDEPLDALPGLGGPLAEPPFGLGGKVESNAHGFSRFGLRFECRKVKRGVFSPGVVRGANW